ncbi:unnamed protein product [Spodoptera littoralis]|uniref:RNA helicase n=1 Tax=Spodoptera littoralis TaxID=7109 RepID=A0A9P0I2L8_SPOLI|nr:unnamed protein product [Spodoptera littoralis]CAH1638656.1 unnamed protein product [Spodoptera littoralis]
MVLAHNINEGLRTQDVQISEDVTFDTMLLKPNTLEGLTNCGFYKPSPIQLHGIPLGKCGFDLLLEAKSGTGKTAVFTVIALEKLDLEKGLQTIIMAPTREIATQICDVITQIGSNYKNLNVEVVIGGLPFQEDVMKFKKNVHIVVGSPGRLRHLVQAKIIDVTTVRLLVLDEADKLMEKSFQADINYIFTTLPKEKQVIMSSATYPETLKAVMNKYVQNAQHMCPDSSTVLLGIKQFVSIVNSNTNIVRQTQYRFGELLKILSKRKFKQCLIFCNYQVRVRDLYRMLIREKWPAEKLHGQQEQNDRLGALKMLQDYKCRILIATDLAARGIDASNIDLVVNFEPPYDWQTYLHRIGRAGRFGSYGIAVTILSRGEEEMKFKRMLKSINGLLELNNFWDKEPIITLDECAPSANASHYEELEKNEAYHELLNRLTNGASNHIEEAESFETLYNSFQQTKENEFESFNDLLTSYETHKENVDDFPYDKISETEYECKPTLTLSNDVILKQNIDMEINENLKNIKELIKLTDKPKLIASQPDINKKPDIILEAPKNYSEMEITAYPQENIPKGPSDLDLDESDLSKALLEAGLPTSFGSSKDNKVKARDFAFNEGSKEILRSNCNKSKPKKRGCKAECKQKQASSKVTFEEISNSCKDDPTSILSNSIKSNIKANLKKSGINQKIEYYDTNSYKGAYEGNNDDEDALDIYNKNIHKMYAIWYKQLKIHVKQVQMSLYIQEMSKM